MAAPFKLTALTPREAVADALHRCILGLDGNDHELFESACVKDESMSIVVGEIKLEGWNTIDDFFKRLSELVTTHITSSIRIEMKDGADTAFLTCNVLAYHVRPEDALKQENTSYMSANLYSIDLVRDSDDGLWKIKKWNIKVLWTRGDIAVIHG